jgi:hypothetical protein
MLDPLKGEVEGFRLGWRAYHPSADQIGEEEYRRDGQGICDPDQRHGNRQIDAEYDRCRCCHDHLKGERDEGHEEPDGESARCRMAVEVPEIGVMQEFTENLKMFVLTHFVVVG